MGKRVKFDPSEVFLKGACSEFEQIALRGSSLWPTVIAMYSACEQRIRVSKFVVQHRLLVAFISNEHGIHVARVKVDGSEHTVEAVCDPIADVMPDRASSMYHTIARSRNPRYLPAIFRKGSTHDAKSAVSHSLFKADSALNDFCVNMVDKMCEFNNNYDGVPRVRKLSLPCDLQTKMVKAFVENKGFSSLSMEDQGHCNAEYDKYNLEVAKFISVMDKTAEFFSTDKWIYVPMREFGMVLGSVTSYAFNAAIDEHKRKLSVDADYTTNFFDFDLKYWPQWYKNYEDIPESIRADFELSCLMMRTHAGNYEGILPPVDIDTGSLQHIVWAPVGSIVRKWYNEYPIYMINK